MRYPPGYRSGQDEALDVALQRLSDALSACGDPLAAVVSQLTGDEVGWALNDISLDDREQVLHLLGLKLRPRKITPALSQDVATLLRRHQGHTQRHAIVQLTAGIRKHLLGAAFGTEPEAAGEAIAKARPGLARAAVWADGVASVRDARSWLWSARQPWFSPEGVTDEQVAAIAHAAQDVVDMSPDYQIGGRKVIVADHGDSAEPPGHEAGDTAEGTGDGTPLSLEELSNMRDDLEVDLRNALAAAQRLVSALHEHRLPNPEDIATVTHAAQSFEAVLAALATAGVHADDASLVSVDEAIKRSTSDAGDQSLRDDLLAVLRLRAPEQSPALASLLRQARTSISDLLAEKPWSDGSRASAGVLVHLNELAGSDVDDTRRLALVHELTSARPELALLALQAQALVVAEPPGPEAAGTQEEPKAQAEPVGDERPSAEQEKDNPFDAAPAVPASESFTGADPVEPAPLVAPVEVTTSAEADVVLDGRTGSPDTEDFRTAQAIADLISASRFGMAAELIERSAQPAVTPLPVLRVAALAYVVRSENGACAVALRSELDALDAGVALTETASLLVAVPALVRTALVTGAPLAGALLAEVAARVEPNLSEVAAEVGKRALRGVLAGSAALEVFNDVTEVERLLSARAETAKGVLRPRTLRFKRATDIAKRWLAPDGLIGKPLTTAAKDDREAVDTVLDLARKLGDPTFVKEQIAVLDRKLKGNSGRSIEGAGLRDLENLASEALQALTGWAESVVSVGRTSRPDEWSAGEVSDMRAVMLARRDAVLAAFAERGEHDDPMVAAAARGGARVMAATFDLLERGLPLSAREPSPALALSVDLLKVPEASVNHILGKVSVPDTVGIEDLVVASRRSWSAAITDLTKAQNFDAARFAIEAAEDGFLVEFDGSRVDLSGDAVAVHNAEHVSRESFGELHGQLTTELRRARLNGEVTDEQDGELTSRLADASNRLGGRDLLAVRRTLEEVAELLPRYRSESGRRLEDRLARIGTADGETVDRVTRLIRDGQLSTAEELIYFLEIGEPPPHVEQRDDLTQFFPAVPEALPDGITEKLLGVVRNRGSLSSTPVLDFSRIVEPEVVAQALAGWRDITRSRERGNISEREQLLPALRLAGIEARRIDKLPDLKPWRDRRFIDITEVDVVGKALVPAFGTKLNRRLRVLLAWGQPGAELLLSHADQDPAQGSLLIAHFGTMSAKTRRELAVRTVGRKAAIVVLDDAALTYLAAHGNRQMDATMSVLLPFSSVNPYLRHKRGLVAQEMFYGRNTELDSLLDPDGTQLVYGGRGLGKSALLRAAGAKFERQRTSGEHVSIYLSLDTLGITGNAGIGADLVWGHLKRELVDRGVISSRGSQRTDTHEVVRANLLRWVQENPQRRVLILLDEADRFFEADAPTFIQTTRLKDLGQASESAVKVVFAGLHSVQRWAKSARNGPFSHLAQRPTVIGPLRPQFASDLLTRPLGALGFAFADVDLVNRVLGFCSYQPFLLQMFGNRLVETMQQRRGEGGLPYVITQNDVEVVEQHADLKADIRDAFHDTLHLDPRYNVIANVLAQHAHEHGLDSRLSDRQLRDECLDWWAAGFRKLDVEGFRAYLHEMVGLGVLAPNNDARGWHLRSPNVLRMIGTQDDVETQLAGADTLSIPEEFIALETRLALPDGRRSPLTAGQVDDIVGDRTNQVRVVLGSMATGIDAVAKAIRAATGATGQFTVPVITRRSQFHDQLVEGVPGTRRVVMTDLFTLEPRADACSEALTDARNRWPEKGGVTRSAVIVAGPAQLPLWLEAQATSEHDTSVGMVSLRRFSRASLRVWALDGEMFTRDERQELLLTVTGGWPVLVEEAAALVRKGNSESRAIKAIESRLAAPAGAADFVEKSGLLADPALGQAYDAISDLAGPRGLLLPEVVAAAEMVVPEDTAALVDCLVLLQVFAVGDDGLHLPEPVLRRCWSQRI
ncbi:AAA family ATPase [Amycolatopsis sp. 3B14]|uniref:AAA family ATPase n=1 Tax=Amycolatopsis sp. 3B14 TaxID=3243600 RepID=UPI003D99FB1B